jgi:hypothetical protein
LTNWFRKSGRKRSKKEPDISPETALFFRQKMVPLI